MPQALYTYTISKHLYREKEKMLPKILRPHVAVGLIYQWFYQ